MNVPSFSSNAFTLRDYIAYLLPGLLFIASIFIVRHDLWVYIKSDPIILSLVLLVGGYIFGYFSNVISLVTICPLLNKLFGDPCALILKGNNRKPWIKGLDKDFVTSLSLILEEIWGKEIIKLPESKLLFLCWRDIQKYPHQGLEYMFRIITFRSFTVSMLFPSLLLSISFFIIKEYYFAIIFIAIFIVMSISRFRLNGEFATNVYRIWFVLNHKTKPNTKT